MTIDQSILIEAESQAVFDAIAQGLLLELSGASHIANDFRPGGAFQLTFDQKGPVSGKYLSIAARRVELSLNVRGFACSDETTHVALDIESTGPHQSRLRVTQQDVSIDSGQPTSAAWKSILGQLQRRVGKTYHILAIPFSLDDLEAPFRVVSDYSVAELTFKDWRNRTVQLHFSNAFKASIFNANGYRGLPCARLVEILHSEEICQLLECGLAGPGDELHHYVLSSNEDRWAEFLASGYTVQVLPAPP